MTEQPIQLDELSHNIGLIKGYLLGMAAPIEVMTSLRYLGEQFVATETENDGLRRLDALIANATPDALDVGAKKRPKWTEQEKADIWKARFTDNKKPAEIALDYPGRNKTAITNLLQKMKMDGYKPKK